ncbi:hypothetical protein IKH79_03315 [Candidatus Saccharibacteria bacterium]|nr:hypothetical protein [Candidatus Saccharibacteria bacterium]
MKNNMTIKLICTMVVLALVAGLLAGCKTEPTNSANDRETSVSGETINTVNPDVSEPNQSIASGALIPDQTTTETTESATSNSNTYTVRGKSFTLSVHLEDYIYEMEGSNCKYFNLDEFMGHYGYVNKSKENYACNYNIYGDDSLSVQFHYRTNSDGCGPESGHPICGYTQFFYLSSYDGTGGIGGFTGAGNTDEVFEINGIVFKDKPSSSWCLTWEQIVLLGVALDDYSQNGNTSSALASISKVFEVGSEGGGGDSVRLNR